MELLWDESAGDTVAPSSPAELGSARAKDRDADRCGFSFEGERGVAEHRGAERVGALGGVGELERDPPEVVAGPGPNICRRRTGSAGEERHACHRATSPSGIRGRTASGSVTCSRHPRQ